METNPKNRTRADCPPLKDQLVWTPEGTYRRTVYRDRSYSPHVRHNGQIWCVEIMETGEYRIIGQPTTRKDTRPAPRKSAPPATRRQPEWTPIDTTNQECVTIAHELGHILTAAVVENNAVVGMYLRRNRMGVRNSGHASLSARHLGVSFTNYAPRAHTGQYLASLVAGFVGELQAAYEDPREELLNLGRYLLAANEKRGGVRSSVLGLNADVEGDFDRDRARRTMAHFAERDYGYSADRRFARAQRVYTHYDSPATRAWSSDDIAALTEVAVLWMRTARNAENVTQALCDTLDHLYFIRGVFVELVREVQSSTLTRFNEKRCAGYIRRALRAYPGAKVRDDLL